MATSSIRILVAFCLLGVASAAVGKLELEVAEQTQEASLLGSYERDLDADTRKTPIQRVVELLKEMKAQLEKEKANDEDLYDQMVCWCETNDKETTKAIDDAQAKITDLTAEIEERAARGAELATQIEQLEKELAEAKEALEKATSMREKEYSEFTAEETEMMQAVTNLKNAIVILGKHNTGLIQASPALVSSMGAVLRDAAARRELLMAEHGEDAKPEDTKALNTMFLSLDAKITRGAGAEPAATATAFAEIGFLKGMGSALKGEGAPQQAGKDALTPEEAGRVLADFAQGREEGGTDDSAFLQKGKKGTAPAYVPQSGVIFGILKQMKEEFEGEMSQNQKDELQAQADYAELKKTKEDQIAAADKAKDEKTAELADNAKKLSDAKEDLQLTNDQLNEDQKFLVNLKLTCQSLDKEWAVRSKTRQEEIVAVGETLAILTEDDARDLMSKTVQFLQTGETSTGRFAEKRALTSMQMRRSRASQLLKAAAAKASQPADGEDWGDDADDWSQARALQQTNTARQLSAMAVQVQLDAFTKVKAAIDDMVAELKAQQEEEVKHKAFCNGEFNDNEKITFEKTKQKEDQEAKIEDLTSTIESLTKEIGEAKTQIGELQVEIKKAGERREKENAEFQTTVADQRATQAILNKAKARMEKFYSKKALTQLGEEAEVGEALGDSQQQQPPVAFKKMKKNAGGSGVMSMLNMIIEDSKSVEKEAIDTETEAQKAYETFVNDANGTINELSTAITSKTEARAQADAEKEQTSTALTNTNAELEQLAAEKADLHEQCDFVLKNFDIRQQARLQEIEALQQAKAILSGAMSE